MTNREISRSAALGREISPGLPPWTGKLQRQIQPILFRATPHRSDFCPISRFAGSDLSQNRHETLALHVSKRMPFLNPQNRRSESANREIAGRFRAKSRYTKTWKTIVGPKAMWYIGESAHANSIWQSGVLSKSSWLECYRFPARFQLIGRSPGQLVAGML